MAVRSFSIGHPEPRVVLSWRGISGRPDSAEKWEGATRLPLLHANPWPCSIPARNSRLFLNAGIRGLSGALVEVGRYRVIH